MAASDVQTYSQSRNSASTLSGVASGAGTGATAGAALGTAVPGIGNIVGGVAGGIIGGIIGGVAGSETDKAAQTAEIEQSTAAERAAIGAKSDEKAMLRAQNAMAKRSAQEGGLATQAAPSGSMVRAAMGSTSVTPYDTWQGATY